MGCATECGGMREPEVMDDEGMEAVATILSWCRSTEGVGVVPRLMVSGELAPRDKDATSRVAAVSKARESPRAFDAFNKASPCSLRAEAT